MQTLIQSGFRLALKFVKFILFYFQRNYELHVAFSGKIGWWFDFSEYIKLKQNLFHHSKCEILPNIRL